MSSAALISTGTISCLVDCLLVYRHFAVCLSFGDHLAHCVYANSHLAYCLMVNGCLADFLLVNNHLADCLLSVIIWQIVFWPKVILSTVIWHIVFWPICHLADCLYANYHFAKCLGILSFCQWSFGKFSFSQ